LFAPRAPPAPAWLTTIGCCPQICASCSVTNRAITSSELPAAVCTMILTGRAGKSSPLARGAIAVTAIAARTHAVNNRSAFTNTIPFTFALRAPARHQARLALSTGHRRSQGTRQSWVQRAGRGSPGRPKSERGQTSLDLTPCNRLAPRAGFEPATNRLTAGCSTAELPGTTALRASARL
jgi:hypothetical protein